MSFPTPPEENCRNCLKPMVGRCLMVTQLDEIFGVVEWIPDGSLAVYSCVNEDCMWRHVLVLRP